MEITTGKPFSTTIAIWKICLLMVARGKQREGQLIFKNDLYGVNLKNLTATILGNVGEVEILPIEITKDPRFEKTYPDLKNKTIRVNKQTKNGNTIYSFEDSFGIPCQIEEKDGQKNYYKKSTVGKGEWLQSVPLGDLQTATGKKIRMSLAIFENEKESIF